MLHEADARRRFTLAEAYGSLRTTRKLRARSSKSNTVAVALKYGRVTSNLEILVSLLFFSPTTEDTVEASRRGLSGARGLEGNNHTLLSPLSSR